MFPRPGPDKTPVQKVSLVTRAGDDLGCCVGYYKQVIAHVPLSVVTLGWGAGYLRG